MSWNSCLAKLNAEIFFQPQEDDVDDDFGYPSHAVIAEAKRLCELKPDIFFEPMYVHANGTHGIVFSSRDLAETELLIVDRYYGITHKILSWSKEVKSTEYIFSTKFNEYMKVTRFKDIEL